MAIPLIQNIMHKREESIVYNKVSGLSNDLLETYFYEYMNFSFS